MTIKRLMKKNDGYYMEEVPFDKAWEDWLFGFSPQMPPLLQARPALKPPTLPKQLFKSIEGEK